MQKDMTEKSDQIAGEKMSSTDVVEKKTWPVDGGRHAWQNVLYFRKKNKAFQKKLRKKCKKYKKMHCQKVKVLLKAAVDFLTFDMASGGNKIEILKPSSTHFCNLFWNERGMEWTTEL